MPGPRGGEIPFRCASERAMHGCTSRLVVLQIRRVVVKTQLAASETGKMPWALEAKPKTSRGAELSFSEVEGCVRRGPSIRVGVKERLAA